MQFPSEIGENGRIWLKKVKKHNSFTTDQWTAVFMAAGCLDRIAEAQRLIAEQGILIPDRFNVMKSNPACKVECDNKILFARLCRETGLFIEDPSRLPKKGGNE